MAGIRNERTGVALTLIGIGLWFWAVEWFPSVKAWAYGQYTWPIPIMGIGAGLLLIGLLTGQYGMSILACIGAGVGGLLYWQNATGNWNSWSYAWALIPGFVGVGIMLTGVLARRPEALTSGAIVLLISLALFAVFGSFLGSTQLAGVALPVALILLGVLLLAGTLLRPRR